ncbi:MAG: winged helix-turn-helix transcriptional regulator [Alphaproteobacteria bacterium]|nr:winged helix-turn-helix transcriptional regulator [Alphaproteobacteria bacterium]
MQIKESVKIFNALSQEIRLSIVLELVKAGKDGLCPCYLVERLNLTNSNLSFHLKELENAELVHSEKKGKFIHYRANCALLKEVGDFLISDCLSIKEEKCCEIGCCEHD